MTLIEPCIDDNNLLMGEILLSSGKISYKDSNLLNIEKLCQILKNNKNEFLNIQCSEKLGIVTFEYFGKKVIITKFGRLTIRRAQNKRDLLNIIAFVINILLDHQLIPALNEIS